jgi:hypothetical protein
MRHSEVRSYMNIVIYTIEHNPKSTLFKDIVQNKKFGNNEKKYLQNSILLSQNLSF